MQQCTPTGCFQSAEQLLKLKWIPGQVSGFQQHHSTYTVLIKIINDIHLNTDTGKISVLVPLNLSAAFDTVDPKIILERLENWVRLSGMVHKWLRSYLERRGYYMSIGGHKRP